jgi:hypothetical protein
VRLLPFAYRVFDDRLAARIAVFVTQPLENAVGRVPLLLRSVLIVGQDLVNDWQQGRQLRLFTRHALSIAGRLVMREYLYERMPTKAILLASSSLAQLVRQHLPTNFCPKLHVGSHFWASLRS